MRAGLAIALLLAGCHAPDGPPDGIHPGAERTIPHLMIQWETPERVNDLCSARPAAPPQGASGCYLNFEGRVIVPIPEGPHDTFAVCILGHEVMHAALGPYHPPGEGWGCW